MTTTETHQVGTIYGFYANEADNFAEIGEEAHLRSHETRMGRRWYIQGDRGMVTFHAPATSTLELCERWLVANQYKANGTMPPDLFEYTRQQ